VTGTRHKGATTIAMSRPAEADTLRGRRGTADERTELGSVGAQAAWSPADFEASTGIDIYDS